MLEDVETDNRRMRDTMIALERERDASTAEASAHLASLSQDQRTADARNLESLAELAETQAALDKAHRDLELTREAATSMAKSLERSLKSASDDQLRLRAALDAERSQHDLLSQEVDAERKLLTDRERDAEHRHDELDRLERDVSVRMEELERRAAAHPVPPASTSLRSTPAPPIGPLGDALPHVPPSPGALPGVQAEQGSNTSALFSSVFARTAPTPLPQQSAQASPPPPAQPSPVAPSPDAHGRFGHFPQQSTSAQSGGTPSGGGYDGARMTLPPSHHDTQRGITDHNAGRSSHTMKVDVPPEPKLKPHPSGDDVYCPIYMDKWGKESLNFLKKQRLWAFWIQTSMSEMIEQNALTNQMAANTIAAHAMLYAAVFDCVPDTSEFKTIRDDIATAAIVANCSQPDGCAAFFAMVNRDVSAAQDSPRVSHAISFFTACNEPMKPGITPSEFVIREGRCDILLHRCYGFVHVTEHDRAIMLKCAFPSSLRSRVNDLFADMARNDRGNIRDYSAFRSAAKTILVSSLDDQKLRDLGHRLSETTADLGGPAVLRVAAPSPPPDLHHAGTPCGSSSGLSDRDREPSAHTSLHASRAQTPPMDPDEAFDVELPDVIRYAADCLCQPWACAARAAAGTSFDKDICLCCGKPGHGKGTDIFRNKNCFAAIDGPGVDNPALLKFSPPAQIAAHQRHSRVLTKYVAMDCPKEGLVMTGGLKDTDAQQRRSSSARPSHSARPATLSTPVTTRPPTPTIAAQATLHQESIGDVPGTCSDDEASTDMDEDEQQFYHPLSSASASPVVFRIAPPPDVPHQPIVDTGCSHDTPMEQAAQSEGLLASLRQEVEAEATRVFSDDSDEVGSSDSDLEPLDSPSENASSVTSPALLHTVVESSPSSDTSHEAAGLSDLETMDSSDSQIGSPGLLQSFDSASTPLSQRSSAASALASVDDDEDQFAGAAHPVLGRDDVTELSSLAELPVAPLNRWYVVRGAASTMVRRPYLSFAMSAARSIVAWVTAGLLSAVCRIVTWAVLFAVINVIMANLACFRRPCAPDAAVTNMTHCSLGHTLRLDAFTSSYVSTASGVAVAVDTVFCPGQPDGWLQSTSTIRVDLPPRGSITIADIPTVDACLYALLVLMLQLLSAWRASAAATFSSPLERLQRAGLHLRVHARCEYLRQRTVRAYRCAIFTALWLLLVCRRVSSRLIGGLPFLAIAVAKLITCNVGPCILAFLLTNQNVMIGATDVGLPRAFAPTVRLPDFPLLPLPSAPPIVYGAYGARDLFVYKARPCGSSASGRFHCKPSTATNRTALASPVDLPPGLRHAQEELDALLSDADQHGLHDTGCSFDCHTDLRAFPVINGVPSLLPPPANVSISGAEGDVKPPEGYGRAQTVMRAKDGEDYIYNSTQSWFTPSFDRALFSESSMGFHARADSKFYFGRRIDFPNATVPLLLKNRVYEIAFKFLDQTTYMPVPHGAEVGGLWRARPSAPPLPPTSPLPQAQPRACAIGVTRGRGTTKPLQADWETQHKRTAVLTAVRACCPSGIWLPTALVSALKLLQPFAMPATSLTAIQVRASTARRNLPTRVRGASTFVVPFPSPSTVATDMPLSRPTVPTGSTSFVQRVLETRHKTSDLV